MKSGGPGYYGILLSIALLINVQCNDLKESSYHNSISPPTNSLSPAFMIEWWELIYDHVTYERIKPPVASRIYAYLGIAAYEAVLPGMPGFLSFENQLAGLKSLPRPGNDQAYDWQIVAIQNVYLVADELLSRHVDSDEKSLLDLRNRQLSDRELEIDAAVYSRSFDYGGTLSQAFLSWIKEDNFNDLRYNTYYKPAARRSQPRFWEPTDINQEACEPYWADIRPFALENAQQCHVTPEIEFSTEPGSAFYEQVLEILEFDRDLTEEQRDIALHWADDPGETATPPGHWTYIMNYAIKKDKLNLEQAVAMYALVGIGIADAFIASWYSKYEINLVRPKTYIREFMDLPHWEPLVETPPFPEYTSAHSVVSTVASEILTSFLGPDYSLIDSTHVQIGLDPRPVITLDIAAREAGMSRLYGGIHYRFSIEDGFKQGQCVARHVLESMQLKQENVP